jgi:hypothetical protein
MCWDFKTLYKLAIKLAYTWFAPEVDRSDFPVGCVAVGAPNFDRFRAGSAFLGGQWRPIGSGEVAEMVNLTVFGYQPWQSTMCLREDVLKRKCRSEPNVNPARAERDHGANL